MVRCGWLLHWMEQRSDNRQQTSRGDAVLCRGTGGVVFEKFPGDVFVLAEGGKTNAL